MSEQQDEARAVEPLARATTERIEEACVGEVDGAPFFDDRLAQVLIHQAIERALAAERHRHEITLGRLDAARQFADNTKAVLDAERRRQEAALAGALAEVQRMKDTWVEPDYARAVGEEWTNEVNDHERTKAALAESEAARAGLVEALESIRCKSLEYEALATDERRARQSHQFAVIANLAAAAGTPSAPDGAG